MEINIEELGCIYCLSNPGLPGLYKIGETSKSTAKRLKQLNNTSIPFDYVIEFSKKVINSRDTEIEAHQYFKQYRVNTKKEFFNANLQSIATYFNENVQGEWEVKPSSNLILNEKRVNTILKNALNVNIRPTAPSIELHSPIQEKMSIKDIHINNLTRVEKDILIEHCLKKKCIEFRMIGGYYFFDSIKKVESLFTNTMKFNAILNSPEMGYHNISSDNFKDIIQDLMKNAPQAFIELDQRLD